MSETCQSNCLANSFLMDCSLIDPNKTKGLPSIAFFGHPFNEDDNPRTSYVFEAFSGRFHHFQVSTN